MARQALVAVVAVVAVALVMTLLRKAVQAVGLEF
jgi:hypothetical protein